MIGVGKIGISASRGGGGAAPNPDFVTVWNVASDGETVTLPLKSGGTFSGTIDWGDTNTSPLSYANRQHTYTTAGTYTITISGDTLQGWAFENTGDRLKITDVSNWGTIFEFDRTRMFQGCANMDVSATDIPTISTTNFTSQFYATGITNPDWSAWDMTGVTTFEYCFTYSTNFNGNIANWVTASTTNIKQMLENCTSFNQDLDTWVTDNVSNAENLLNNATSFNSSVANWTLNGTWFRPFNNTSVFTGIGVDTWDTSGLVSAQNMFVNCYNFNGDTSGWDTSSLLNANNMFYRCFSYDQDMSGWDINQVTNFTNFCFNVTLSTTNYDALLIAWDAQGAMAFSGVAHFGSSKYTSGGAAEAARTSLISKWGGISDGGAA